VSSTGAEHETAHSTARRVAGFFTGISFPVLIIEDSGNEAHLFYRIDLPNDNASPTLVMLCLDVLDVLFSEGTATVDIADYNAARIRKLYGTMRRNGTTPPTAPSGVLRSLNLRLNGGRRAGDTRTAGGVTAPATVG